MKTLILSLSLLMLGACTSRTAEFVLDSEITLPGSYVKGSQANHMWLKLDSWLREVDVESHSFIIIVDGDVTARTFINCLDKIFSEGAPEIKFRLRSEMVYSTVAKYTWTEDIHQFFLSPDCKSIVADGPLEAPIDEMLFEGVILGTPPSLAFIGDSFDNIFSIAKDADTLPLSPEGSQIIYMDPSAVMLDVQLLLKQQLPYRLSTRRYFASYYLE